MKKRVRKPRRFSVAIYNNPDMPVMKTAFVGSDKTIVTNRYCLDINCELTEKVKEKIRKSIERFVIKY